MCKNIRIVKYNLLSFFCILGMMGFVSAAELSSSTSAIKLQQLSATRTNFENLSLDECIDIALEKNLTMLTAKENVKISESQYRVNKGVITPTASLSGSDARSNPQDDSDSATLSASKYFTSGATLSASFGSARSSDSTEGSYTSTGSISLTQPLLSGLGGSSVNATKKGLAILDEQIEIVRSLQDTKASLIYNVTSEYYQLIGALRNINTAQESVDEAERVLKVAKVKKEEGLVAKIDVTRSEVQVATQKASLITAQQSYESSVQSFLDLMGLETGTYLTIQTTINYAVRDVKLDDYIKLAFKNRVDWRSAELTYEQSVIALKIAKLAKDPELDAGLSYSASKTTTGLTDSLKLSNPELTASLTWSIPLWQSYATLKESYLQAISNKKIAEISKDETRRSITLSVRQAVIAVEEAKQNLEIIQKSIAAAEESLELAKKSYEEGMQTYLDVQDAQTSYTTTQTSYTSALISYLVALANLDQVVASDPRLQ
jgi:outer membrane protein